MTEFKTGNIVRLRSGGPRMTVQGIFQVDNEKGYKGDLQLVYLDARGRVRLCRLNPGVVEHVPAEHPYRDDANHVLP